MEFLITAIIAASAVVVSITALVKTNNLQKVILRREDKKAACLHYLNNVAEVVCKDFESVDIVRFLL